MQKFLLLLLCLLMVVTTTGFSSPNVSPVEAQLSQKLSDQQKDYYHKFKENNGNIEVLSKEQEKQLLKAEKENKTVKEFYKNLKGYKEVKLDKNSSAYSVFDDNGSMFLKYRAYENEKTNSAIVTTSIYSAKNNTLIAFRSEKKVSKKDGVKAETLVNYNYLDDGPDYLNTHPGGGGGSVDSWSWNGGSFLCGMVGILTCIPYCTVWAKTHIRGAASICDVTCGTAMIIACM